MVCQIYRCYILWSYQLKVVILPILLLLGTTSEQPYLTYRASLTPALVSGYRSVYNFTQMQITMPRATTAWGDAMFILSLVTNLLVTSLIGLNSEFPRLLM